MLLVGEFCVRDMRKYPFWAHDSECIEILHSIRTERYCAIARPEGTRPNNYELQIANYESNAGVLTYKFFVESR